jgi:hypothetical protein
MLLHILSILAPILSWLPYLILLALAALIIAAIIDFSSKRFHWTKYALGLLVLLVVLLIAWLALIYKVIGEYT